MKLNLKKHKEELLFLPLGGSGEIGMNVNLYQLDGKWIMIDFGAGFAEDFLPGVDMIAPDLSFILDHDIKIEAIILTHAHEDHLGAITYLWHEVENCPIYATPFTAAFLRNKLNDNNVPYHNKIIEVAPGSDIEIGPFKLELIQLTHSVPEMNAIAVKTRHGTILHTGDWKLDPNPLIGPVSEEDKLRKYGEEGVLAMVCDSTNVFNPGHSGSEGDLRESLAEILKDCKQLVCVTTFASNVARIETIAEAAIKSGRKVALIGRSLWRIVSSAKESGYLTGIDFIDETNLNKYKREQMVIICTGCQGEPLAAVNKIVSGTHRTAKLIPGDTIIFSSKIIPGNEKRIFRLFNQFVKLGIEVITEKDHFVHVSGHPNRDELKRMYELVKPQIAIPVHGERVHMHEHSKLARSFGVPQTVEVENGVLVKLAPGAAEKITVVESGYLAVDGYMLLPPDGDIMKMRRKMQREGIVLVTLIMSKDMLKTAPVIYAPGVLDTKEDDDLIEEMAEEVSFDINNTLKKSKMKNKRDTLIQVARSSIRRFIKDETGKNPSIEIKIVDL